MDDLPSGKRRIRPDLAAALRAARADDAKRSEALNDLGTLALTRLGVLRDALEPVLAQLPADADLFDVGLMPGDPPRLFVDMIAFVEMARDRRGYRLFQDRRHGRALLAECETLDAAVDAVTAYLARRLVEREKALASDAAAFHPSPVHAPKSTARKPPTPFSSWLDATRVTGSPWYWFAQAFWFLVEVLGLLALFALLWMGIRLVCT